MGTKLRPPKQYDSARLIRLYYVTYLKSTQVQDIPRFETLSAVDPKLAQARSTSISPTWFTSTFCSSAYNHLFDLVIHRSPSFCSVYHFHSLLSKLANMVPPSLAGAVIRAAISMDFRSMFQNPENQWSSNTQVFFPNDPQFASSTERWNAYERPTYKAAVRPGSAEDVQKIVSTAPQ